MLTGLGVGFVQLTWVERPQPSTDSYISVMGKLARSVPPVL